MPPTLKLTLLMTAPLLVFRVTNEVVLMMPYSAPSGAAAMSLKRVPPSLPNCVKPPVNRLMVPKLLLPWLNCMAYASWPKAEVETSIISPDKAALIHGGIKHVADRILHAGRLQTNSV